MFGEDMDKNDPENVVRMKGAVTVKLKMCMIV